MAFTTLPITTDNASNNPFPKVKLVKGTAPGAATAGQLNLFADTADTHVKVEDESAVVRDLEVMQAVPTSTPAVLIDGYAWLQDDTVNKVVSIYIRKSGVTKGPFPLFNYT